MGDVPALPGLQCWDAQSICLLVSRPACTVLIGPWSRTRIREQKLLHAVLQLVHPTVAVSLPRNKAFLWPDPIMCWSRTHQQEGGHNMLFYCSSRCAELFSVLSLPRGGMGQMF